MYVKATTADRVKSGRGLGVQLNQLFIGIYNVDGEYFAIGDVCPHMGGTLHAERNGPFISFLLR